MTEDRRVCDICGGPLRRDSKLGVCSRSAKCRTVLNSRKFKRDHEKRLAWQRAWAARNREYINAKQNELFVENREERLTKRKAYEAQNPEIVAAWRARAITKRAKVRAESFDKRRQVLIAGQRGICPCGQPLDDNVAIDHDHTCCDMGPKGGARGACGNCDRAAMHASCNVAIGMVKEDAERLRNLASYIEFWVEARGERARHGF